MYSLSIKFDPELLPNALCARYPTADGPALKAAIWLLLGNPADPEKLSGELKLSKETAVRALEFWHGAGLLCDADAPPNTTALPVCQGPVSALAAKDPRPMISFQEIARISLRNPEIAALFQEVQRCLGRPVSDDESSRLMAIYKYDDLPADVILMIADYAKGRAKRGVMGYIERVARVWAEDGIDTAEKAEARVRLLETRERREGDVASALGLERDALKYRDRLRISQWFEEFGYGLEFVDEAALRCNEEQKGSVPYIHSILKSWHESGIKSVKETRTAPSNAPVRTAKKASGKISLSKRAAQKLLEEQT